MSEQKETKEFVSGSCKGEVCTLCKAPATHKLQEVVFLADDPQPMRHGSSAYVCKDHFEIITKPENHSPLIQTYIETLTKVRSRLVNQFGLFGGGTELNETLELLTAAIEEPLNKSLKIL
jgi:hypothetical protein